MSMTLQSPPLTGTWMMPFKESQNRHATYIVDI